jgi:hypothetical protein
MTGRTGGGGIVGADRRSRARTAYDRRRAMKSVTTILPFMLLMGVVFGALGAAGAYAISYAEYRQRFLRPGQSATRMALQVAGVTFAFFVVAAAVLGLILGQAAR